MADLAVGCEVDADCVLGYGDDVSSGGRYVDYCVTIWNKEDADRLIEGIHRCGRRWYPEEYAPDRAWMIPTCEEGVCKVTECTPDNYDGYCPGVAY
jgi:hypothetical protein